MMFEFLLLCQIKHWFVDFHLQTMKMVNGKGIYGNPHGILHSLQHGVFTTFIGLFFTGLPIACVIGVFDFITHYHIDWFKMNYGNRDIQTPQFWSHLGLDQMAHQFVYITLAWYLSL